MTPGPRAGTAATCVECNLPDRELAKYVAKAGHGFRHSRAFTRQNFHEPILEITPGDRQIVRVNWMRCHESFVHAVVGSSTGDRPGLAIMLTVLAMNLLGDGLRDVLDPRLKT